MKEYYLDTNAVRSLGKDLTEFSHSGFTSAFTLIELIAGICKSDFKYRKAAIATVMTSGLYIDWRIPIEVIISTLDIKDSFEELSSNDIKLLTRIIMESEDYEECVIKGKSVEHGIEYVKLFDFKLSNGFREALNSKVLEVRKVRDATGQKIAFHARKEKFVRAIVNFIYETLFNSLRENVTKKIVTSYNGEIDAFLLVWMKYYETKVNSLSESSRNDWADIIHTIYLGNSGTMKFVTDDKKALSLINSVIHGRAINLDTYRGQ